MNKGLNTSFLTNYISSLGERTRDERGGTNYGFDTIIYNLALAKGWKPMRLPFMRRGANRTAKTKPEREFGVDASFLNKQSELIVFVLKDEPLVYKEYIKANFDSDLRLAAACDLRDPELNLVTSVRIILAYNKDHDDGGVACFDRLVSGLPKKINKARLRFERWNLSEIVSQVEGSLMNASLLPQRFFGRLSYLTSQIGEFTHGSDEWVNQLVPNWRGFLSELFKEGVSERTLRMVPVAVLVLAAHQKQHPSRETGLIDLLEWAMLAVWEAYRKKPTKNAYRIVRSIWVQMYLGELLKFVTANRARLATENSLDVYGTNSSLDCVASAYVAMWHLARIGLLSMAVRELVPMKDETVATLLRDEMNKITGTMIGLINANPGCLRPVLDLHHIELFLTWRCLWVFQRDEDIVNWTDALLSRLALRRSGIAALPFVCTNSWEIAFEQSISPRKTSCDGKASYLLQMLIELSCYLPPERAESVIRRIENELLHPDKRGTIHLFGWIPPADWESRILWEEASDGTGIVVELTDDSQASEPRVPQIVAMVADTRKARPMQISEGIPKAVLVLGCLKNQSPLPPEMWRQLIFNG